MGRRGHEHMAPLGRHGVGLLFMTLLALGCLLVGAGVASARIDDPDAEPSWAFFLTGSAAGGDNALDVAVTTKATWVAGQVYDGAVNELDASLARIPAGSSAQPTVQTWNSTADDNDANYAVAARGSHVYTAGATRNAADNLDLTVIRWSSSTGAFTWVRRYARAAGKDDIATDVVIDSGGNAIVCGTTENAAEFTAWVVRKYSSAGKLRWTWTYDGSAAHADAPVEMVVDSRDNIYVTGSTQQDSPSGPDTVSGCYTLKLSPKGAKLWAKSYKGPNILTSAGTAIARCPSGGVYVGGHTQINATAKDCFLLRYAADGRRTVFERPLVMGSVENSVNDLAVASNGRIYAVGQRVIANQNRANPIYVMWNPSGTHDDTVEYFSDDEDAWEAVATDAHGGVYMTGFFDLTTTVNPNIRTMRRSVLSEGGTWTSDYSPNGYNREVNALAVGGLTCAVVGRQYNGADYDQYVHIWTY